jgi:hypothetical protein
MLNLNLINIIGAKIAMSRFERTTGNIDNIFQMRGFVPLQDQTPGFAP